MRRADDVEHRHQAAIDDVEPFVVGRERDAVGNAAERFLADHHVDASARIDAIDVAAQLALQHARPCRLPDLRVQTSLLVARTARDIGHPFVDLSAVRRIGEPVAAVRMAGDVVRRVQPLALERIGDHRYRSVVLVAHDAAAGVLARQLAPLMIERVAVAVARRLAEDGDTAVILEPSHLPVVRDVAPDQILPLAVPGRSLAPHRRRSTAAESACCRRAAR